MLTMKTALMAILLLAFGVPSAAALPFRHELRKENIVGEIVVLKGNHVQVRDEKTLEVYRFFAHTKRLEPFEEGERMRVYFYRGNNALISMKEMAPLECGESQNLGNLSGC